MTTMPAERFATALFALALLHTFAVGTFRRMAAKFPRGSAWEIIFHGLGEVELVFGIWAAVLFVAMAIFFGNAVAVTYLESCNFTEALFVFAILTVAATRPVLSFATTAVAAVSGVLSRVLTIPAGPALFFTVLVIGPLLGSLVTEPAAMTITALFLKNELFDRGLSPSARYFTLAVLLVNVSVGGVLTHFAAPPVLMVADIWGWTTPFVFSHFGVKAMLAVVVNAAIATVFLWRQLAPLSPATRRPPAVPAWLVALHLAFLALVVFYSHHPAVFLGALFFLIVLVAITRRHQSPLRFKEGLLVGFFLAGLVVLGGPQRWWLEPIVAGLSPTALFLSATALTAFTDNAALTYLGAQIPQLSDALRYALVAGAVAGGGLTVIANAPNPAGFAILDECFGENGIHPGKLFVSALLPTAVAMAAFWLL